MLSTMVKLEEYATYIGNVIKMKYGEGSLCLDFKVEYEVE